MPPPFTNYVESPPLTGMERRTLTLLIQGRSAKQIADELSVSVSYVYCLLRLLRYRFDVNTVTGVVVKAIVKGMVSEDTEDNQ